MYFLVRRLTGRGSSEALETDYQGDSLTLGQDAMLALPGIDGLLELKPDGSGGARFTSRRLEPTRDGEPAGSGTLAVGDSLELPGYVIDIVAPPSGFDLGVQITATGERPAAAYGRMELDGGLWSVRRASWVLALLVLLAFLLVPVAGLFQPELAGMLRESPLPDDGLWSSGPLASAHRTAGVAEDCQACHATPFVMVRDEACLACHRTTREHADLDVHDPALFTGERCASCHREHNEPAHLVISDKGVCTDCHADTGQWDVPGSSGMEPVHAFTAEGHPDFRLALLQPQGPGGAHGWLEVRERRSPQAVLSEQSNLKFDHAVHLDIDKVQNEATGESLGCASCHTLKEDGEHFEAVTMDNHCRSCHALNFDVFEPDLELPHGDTRAAIVAMEAHFIREFTDPELRRERAGQKPRRVPGKRYAAATCEGSGLDCGRAEAVKEAQYQFLETGCITCHQVEDTGLADISDRWFVQPVRVTADWYPHSRFDHSAHLSLAGGGEAELCASCHDAVSSSVATDVLIPGQDNCLACHDEKLGASLADCVACHAFHPKQGPLSILARGVTQNPAAMTTSGSGE